MNAYIYQAALLCDDCAEKVMADLKRKGKAPKNPRDEHTFDSDDYPKGPYPDGGGEADSPQHCDHCEEFLENPLTGDGEKYVLDAVKRGTGRKEILNQWKDYYDYLKFDDDVDESKSFFDKLGKKLSERGLGLCQCEADDPHQHPGGCKRDAVEEVKTDFGVYRMCTECAASMRANGMGEGKFAEKNESVLRLPDRVKSPTLRRPTLSTNELLTGANGALIVREATKQQSLMEQGGPDDPDYRPMFDDCKCGHMKVDHHPAGCMKCDCPAYQLAESKEFPPCKQCGRPNRQAALGEKCHTCLYGNYHRSATQKPKVGESFEVVLNWEDDYEAYYPTYQQAVAAANKLADGLVAREGWEADRSWASRQNTYAINLTKPGYSDRTIEVLGNTEEAVNIERKIFDRLSTPNRLKFMALPEEKRQEVAKRMVEKGALKEGPLADYVRGGRPTQTCNNCGAKNDAEDFYCECGAELPALKIPKNICPTCGEPALGAHYHETGEARDDETRGGIIKATTQGDTQVSRLAQQITAHIQAGDSAPEVAKNAKAAAPLGIDVDWTRVTNLAASQLGHSGAAGTPNLTYKQKKDTLDGVVKLINQNIPEATALKVDASNFDSKVLDKIKKMKGIGATDSGSEKSVGEARLSERQQTFLTRADEVGSGPYDSVKWALEVHCGSVDNKTYNSAVLYGNEDSPVQIDFYKSANPNHDAKPDWTWLAGGVDEAEERSRVRNFEGVPYVARGVPAPKNFKSPSTCGNCGRTWDDAVISAWTPTPAARCPFEYFRGHNVDDIGEARADHTHECRDCGDDIPCNAKNDKDCPAPISDNCPNCMSLEKLAKRKGKEYPPKMEAERGFELAAKAMDKSDNNVKCRDCGHTYDKTKAGKWTRAGECPKCGWPSDNRNEAIEKDESDPKGDPSDTIDVSGDVMTVESKMNEESKMNDHKQKKESVIDRPEGHRETNNVIRTLLEKREPTLNEDGGTLSLIVKGNKFQAARAAADHGIPAAFKKETGKGETILLCGDQFRDVVAKWFGEPGEAPYPVGTLLHYGTGLVANNLDTMFP